jgi:hypothetical protein
LLKFLKSSSKYAKETLLEYQNKPIKRIFNWPECRTHICVPGMAVIFVDSECSACGVVGDRRLLPDYCHMEEQLAHTGSLRHLHPSPVHAYHPLHLGQSLLSNGTGTYYPLRIAEPES